MFYGRGKSALYKMLVALQAVSFIAEYLIDAYRVETDDYATYLFVLLSEFILFLIISPWGKIKILYIYVKENGFDRYFENFLKPTLLLIFLMNLVLAIIIMVMIPDVSEYKLKDGWKELYESIPMFALLNRISYITQFMGYFAVPISFTYFAADNKKSGALFLFLSTSSLMAGIAAYSRAQMLTYGMCLLASFFLFQNIFPISKLKVINKYTYRALVVLVVIFLYTTINRFGSDNMAYYGDRIPKTSKVQDPIVYSLMDYPGQGFANGINLLYTYTPSKNFMGQDVFYYPLLFLSYFGIIDWDSSAAEENRDKVYGYDGGAFHGYACTLIYNFGFIVTLLYAILYFSYIRRSVSLSSRVSVGKAMLLAFLVIEPTTSIFYSSIGIYWFPLLFYIGIKVLYRMKLGGRRTKVSTPNSVIIKQ